MPRSHKGHKFILCIIDEVTNYLITVPIYQAKTEEIGEVLIVNVITKVSGTFREYYELLNKRLKYLHDILLNFKSKMLAMINKAKAFFQHKGGDLVYIISSLTSQLQMASWKVASKYVGPVEIYKVIDPHNYLL